MVLHNPRNLCPTFRLKYHGLHIDRHNTAYSHYMRTHGCTVGYSASLHDASLTLSGEYPIVHADGMNVSAISAHFQSLNAICYNAAYNSLTIAFVMAHREVVG